jgi:hypothetical protein
MLSINGIFIFYACSFIDMSAKSWAFAINPRIGWHSSSSTWCYRDCPCLWNIVMSSLWTNHALDRLFRSDGWSIFRTAFLWGISNLFARESSGVSLPVPIVTSIVRFCITLRKAVGMIKFRHGSTETSLKIRTECQIIRLRMRSCNQHNSDILRSRGRLWPDWINSNKSLSGSLLSSFKESSKELEGINDQLIIFSQCLAQDVSLARLSQSDETTFSRGRNSEVRNSEVRNGIRSPYQVVAIFVRVIRHPMNFCKDLPSNELSNSRSRIVFWFYNESPDPAFGENPSQRARPEINGMPQNRTAIRR